MDQLSLHEFESQKNKKALLFTIIVCAVFLMFAFFYTWKVLNPPIPETLDLIAINLGNEQEGIGDIQPLVKGDRAPDNQSIPAEVSGKKSTEVPSQQINADEQDEPDAAPVIKAKNPVKEARDINKESTTKSTKAVNPSPIVNPVPTPPKPKNLYKGGTGNGGNGATEDNGYRNQGYKGTTGDMGSPDGKPDSYGNSPGGRSGISVVKGLSGRKRLNFPSMTDDFNENAKVYVDIVVNPAGKVLSAVIARGTTTSNSNLRSIAKDKALGLKFNASSSGDNQTGTILFNFVLKN